MKVSTLVLGMVFGFAAGWLVFGTGAVLPPTPSSPPSIEPSGSSPGPGETVVESDGPTPEEVLAALRSGSSGKIQSVLGDRDRTWTEEEVRALIDRTDRARAEGDTNSFRAALRWLGRANTRAAQEKLLRLMEDASLHPPIRLGDLFLDGLADSDLPGIALAARRRFERNVAAGDTSWTAGHGYFELIAATGTPDDLAWLVDHAVKGVDRSQARRALAKSKRPEVAARAIRLIEDGKADQDFLNVFASNHPGSSADPLRRILAGEVDASYRELSSVFRAYGNSVSEEGLGDARAFLTSFRDPMREVTAVYAVQQFRRRGFDLSGFESVILAPTVFLERVTPDSNTSIASKARYAIEYNRVAWSARAAVALERAAETLPASSMTRDMVEIAKKVRAGLESHWK